MKCWYLSHTNPHESFHIFFSHLILIVSLSKGQKKIKFPHFRVVENRTQQSLEGQHCIVDRIPKRGQESRVVVIALSFDYYGTLSN